MTPSRSFVVTSGLLAEAVATDLPQTPIPKPAAKVARPTVRPALNAETAEGNVVILSILKISSNPTITPYIARASARMTLYKFLEMLSGFSVPAPDMAGILHDMPIIAPNDGSVTETAIEEYFRSSRSMSNSPIQYL